MSETKKNREWVKTAAIIFLTILLLLTFFSGTIQNFSLPEVAVEYAQSGSVSSGVRVSGSVAASKTYSVTMPDTRTVSAVYVRNGDEVEAGQLLFELEDTESDELKEARKQLETLQADYQKAVLSASGVDFTAEQQAIDAAQAAYNKAASDLSAYQASVNATDEKKAYLDAMRVVESLKQWAGGGAGGSYTPAGEGAVGASDEIAYTYYANYVGLATSDELFNEVADSAGLNPGDPGYVHTIDTIFTNIKAEYNSFYNTVLSTAQADVSRTGWALNELGNSYASAVTSAQQTLDAAKAALTTAQKNAANTEAISKIDLSSQLSAIADQKDVIAKLEAKYGTSQITATTAGIVSDLAAVAGEKLTADSVALVLQLTTNGYTAEVSVDKTQIQRVSVGAAATVSGYYWGTAPSATVTSIRSDPNDSQKRLVTLTLSGDVSIGSSYNFVIGDSSSSYDTVVPKSAVREDNNGKFVLVVTTKSTPLGNRYYATRMDVTVLASDDTRCAVSGDFSGWDYVITSSSAPIEAGAQVRMAS